ncbi:MAG: hypothetical protein FWE74_06010 [Oscillospiraceae bacterium]|nr:hypothetical protein [Oscillospiraceae bacterium]
MKIIMAYEAKVLLVAMSNILRKSKDIKEAHKALEEMANSEGVILKPIDDEGCAERE